MNINIHPVTDEQAYRGLGATVSVTLSERNLSQLLAALEAFEQGVPGFSPTLSRRCEDGTFLTVVAEPNDEHYERREPGPGFDGIV